MNKVVATRDDTPTTFVLVHGAWHGGWCWNKLTPLLRAAGHQVFTPTLTGLGERAHLLTPEIDLATHIKDIVSVLEYEDLHDVVLVGHSYGGMVIAGVAEAIGSRVAHLVFLDGFLPESGKALTDYAPMLPTRDDGWRVPALGTSRDFGVTDERDIAWADPRIGDQPIRAITQPVQLSAQLYDSFAKTYIQLTEAPWFVEAAERAKRQRFRSYTLLSGGHDAMISQPKAVAEILLDVARFERRAQQIDSATMTIN
ncbi:MAG: alpha/beta hydrolase [Roseiflexaceae bacterium]|nr:alpha/beta hydrolase [Roseiflexaceae bacterium]